MRCVRVHHDPGLREQFRGAIQAGPSQPDGHRGHERAGVVEGLHRAREAVLGGDIGIPEQGARGHPAVVEDEGRGVRGTDTELVFEADQGHPGIAALDHKGLDRAPTKGAIQRGPHDHDIRALAGGDEDLFPI